MTTYSKFTFTQCFNAFGHLRFILRAMCLGGDYEIGEAIEYTEKYGAKREE